ncbi:MAG: aerobic carbon-monoxide dehydrogenase large subunit [Actinomycetota bacterium]|jgi:carbon-monoxide dehydrogenase large subunit|nr:aerobic carbon-monoxide dehydrogenase large subunit [Actinomycetota bacterium]
MSILGNRVLRKEDPKFLTTGGTYVDDLPLEGAAFVAFVRSTMAHARIAELDLDEARQAPGVVGVFAAADVDLEPIVPEAIILNQAMGQPPLATDVVRFVGEPVVAVVAETRTQAVDAAELVFVDYEPLPAVVDPEDAVTDATVLHEGAGTNLVLDLAFGRTDELLDGCDVVITQRIRNQRVAPCPLEVRAGAAQWGEDGRLTYWCSTQGAHTWKREIAKALGIDEEQVRIISPDVGGGFGAKIHSYPEDVLIPQLARMLGRPVRWVDTRSESMVALGHGRAQIQDVELGGTRDGKLLAYRLTVLQDGGAYPRIGSVLPYMTRTMLTGVYDIPKGEFNSKSVVTNTTPIVAYRGAGRPEATAAIERMMDLYAAEIGMDPAEVRRRNLIHRDAFPYNTITGTQYDIGDYERALDLVLEAAGYDELRADQARRREANDRVQLGIGVVVYVEITNVENSAEFASVEVLPDGKAIVRTGTSPHGQGHVTAWAMLASEQTGIPIEDIDVVHGDTDQVPTGGGTSGSRSLQAGGVAVNQAAVALVDKARQRAAELLEANPDDVVLDRVDARFHVAGTPAVAKTWADVAAGDELLRADVDFSPVGATFPFGAHIAVVEVDTETGKVDLLRMVAVDDAGRILNPLLAEGQIHGGLAQGVAQALYEEVRYDDDGNPVTSNLADYAFPSAAELPSFETVSMETPTPLNELGAKGIGESGTIGSTPAVQNAVIDALAPLGVRHVDMPCTPERVWLAIRGVGEPPSPERGPAAAGTGSVDT